MSPHLQRLCFGIAAMLLSQCSSGPKQWHYDYEPGKTCVLYQDLAVPPTSLPGTVIKAVVAGNQLRTKPYRYGGGHGHLEDTGYDCSGSVSYVLRQAGLLDDVLASDEFRHYGKSGEGKWITVYAKRGHAFIVVAGLRLDTSGDRGPRWTKSPRSIRGFRARHPADY